MGSAPRIDRLDRNFLDNSNFTFWQRNTSQSSSLGSIFSSADRWRPSVALGGGVALMSRSNNVPSLRSKYSMRVEVTTAQASLGTSDGLRVLQFSEGIRMLPLVDGMNTLHFQFRTNKAGTYSVAIQNVGAVRTYVTQFTVTAGEALSQSWVKRVLHIPYEAVGWINDASKGMTALISLADNQTSTNAGSANAWVAGSHTWVTGQVNLMDTIGNYVEIAEIGLLKGKFDDPEYGAEDAAHSLQLARRYYEIVYSGQESYGSAGQFVSVATPYSVMKRVIPVVTLISGSRFGVVESTPLIQDQRSYAHWQKYTKNGVTGGYYWQDTLGIDAEM